MGWAAKGLRECEIKMLTKKCFAFWCRKLSGWQMERDKHGGPSFNGPTEPQLLTSNRTCSIAHPVPGACMRAHRLGHRAPVIRMSN